MHLHKTNRPTWKPPVTPSVLFGSVSKNVDDGETSEVITSEVPLDSAHLGEIAPPEFFSLENQIKAGVNLKQVDCNVLPSNPNGQYTSSAELSANEILNSLESDSHNEE